MAKYTGLDKEFLKNLKKSPSGQNNQSLQADIDARDSEGLKRKLRSAMGTLPPNSGLAQTEPMQPRINFVAGPAEKSISSNDGNAAIVLGYDRPGTLASGMGGKGVAGSNTIDIVVGRMSCKKDSLSKGLLKAVNPSFVCDAARIYVSQLTEIDLNFGLSPGILGSAAGDGQKLKPGSAIGLKADGVRIIGREGEKS